MTAHVPVPASGPTRDHRIDLVRGFALACIFINHIPEITHSWYTPRNYGFSDSAELFVMLAGVSAALAYATRMQQAPGQAMLKAWRRSGVLYLAHIASTLAVFGLFILVAWATATPQYLDAINIRPAIVDPAMAAVRLLSGGYQLNFFDILPMYVALMAMLPALLWLGLRDVRVMLAASFALYLATQSIGLRMPSWPSNHGWFFNPFAWQLLFACGLAMGLAMRNRTLPRFNGWLYALALGWIVLAVVWCLGRLPGRIIGEPLPLFVDSFAKGNIALPRIAHVLALTYVVVYSPLWGWLAKGADHNPLTWMGRHSLPVFCAGSLLSMAGWIVIGRTSGGFWIETAVVIAGMALMIALAAGLDRRRAASRRSKAITAPAGSATAAPSSAPSSGGVVPA
jgi:hypothetical protein